MENRTTLTSGSPACLDFFMREIQTFCFKSLFFGLRLGVSSQVIIIHRGVMQGWVASEQGRGICDGSETVLELKI